MRTALQPGCGVAMRCEQAAGRDEPVTHPEKTYMVGQAEIAARPLKPALYLVATPIGNLGDITLRALETLAAADMVACEDTRVTRVLLDRYGIRQRPTAYHEHNADEAGPRLIEALASGKKRGAGVRCRHAAGLRSRLPPCRTGARGRHSRRADPRGVGSAGSVDGVRAALRRLSVRRLPAGKGWAAADAARRAQGGASDADFFRIAAPAHRHAWRQWPTCLATGRRRSAAS